MESTFYKAQSFNQPLDAWNVAGVTTMRFMFSSAPFNQCLSTWASKTVFSISTKNMLKYSDCPNGNDTPDANQGPWCQDEDDGCIVPSNSPSLSAEPSLEPSVSIEPSASIEPSISPSSFPSDSSSAEPSS